MQGQSERVVRCRPMDPASSTAVLREALAGSDAALDRLYDRFGPRLLSFIRLKMGRGES